MVDDFRDIGTLRAKAERASTNWLSCQVGRGTYVKTEIVATITFGKRANGSLVVDVQVSGASTWYAGQPRGTGTAASAYSRYPCSSTGDLERAIIEEIADPLQPLDSVTK